MPENKVQFLTVIKLKLIEKKKKLYKYLYPCCAAIGNYGETKQKFTDTMQHPPFNFGIEKLYPQTRFQYICRTLCKQWKKI